MSDKRVKSGDSIKSNLTASAWNSFLETASVVAAHSGGLPSAIAGDQYGNNCRIRVRNDSGGHLDSKAIVGVGFAVFDPSGQSLTEYKNNTPLFKGATPVVATHWNRPAVLIQSISKDYIGEAMIAGVVAAQVDIQNIQHKWADVQASTVSLKSYATGSVKILSEVTQTGVQWCKVQLGHVFRGTLLGKPDADSEEASGGLSMATVSIYDGDHVDTTFDVEAVCIVDVEAGKWVSVEEIDGVYHAFKIEC